MREGKQKRNDLRFRVHREEGQPDDDVEDDYEDISDLDTEEILRLNHQLEAGSNATQLADIENADLDAAEAADQNYYKENIFNKEDYFLYKGIIQIYS